MSCPAKPGLACLPSSRAAGGSGILAAKRPRLRVRHVGCPRQGTPGPAQAQARVRQVLPPDDAALDLGVGFNEAEAAFASDTSLFTCGHTEERCSFN